jgi:hypothetical protein
VPRKNKNANKGRSPLIVLRSRSRKDPHNFGEARAARIRIILAKPEPQRRSGSNYGSKFNVLTNHFKKSEYNIVSGAE